MRAIMATTSARCAPAAAGEGLGQSCSGMGDPCSVVGGLQDPLRAALHLDELSAPARPPTPTPCALLFAICSAEDCPAACQGPERPLHPRLSPDFASWLWPPRLRLPQRPIHHLQATGGPCSVPGAGGEGRGGPSWDSCSPPICHHTSPAVDGALPVCLLLSLTSCPASSPS